MAYRLEPLTPADAAFRWEVYTAAIKPWIDELLDLSEDQQWQMVTGDLAAGRQGAIVVNDVRVGMMLIEESDSAISLSQIALLPAYQGLGIGSAVLESLVERARRAGKPLTLRVFHGNTRARALYERFGFRVTAHGEHDLEMQWSPGDQADGYRTPGWGQSAEPAEWLGEW
jgi:ribosomal protein S18 acetylase RimI-like enzyme